MKKISQINHFNVSDSSTYSSQKIDELIASNASNSNSIEFNHNVPRNSMKDITTYYTDGSLWDRINGSNGFSPFEDIFVGDFFKLNNSIKTSGYSGSTSEYVTIVGINTLWSYMLKKNHIVLVPGKGDDPSHPQHFGSCSMYDSTPFTGGYKNSKMCTTILGSNATSPNASGTINEQLLNEFDSHLVSTTELVSSANNSTSPNKLGQNTGVSTSSSSITTQSVLLSEIELYGSTVFSSSGFDTGTAKTQFPLFKFSPISVNNGTSYYWLKDVASSSCFCDSYGDGRANCNGAGIDYCVRPRFVLAK